MTHHQEEMYGPKILTKIGMTVYFADQHSP